MMRQKEFKIFGNQGTTETKATARQKKTRGGIFVVKGAMREKHTGLRQLVHGGRL